MRVAGVVVDFVWRCEDCGRSYTSESLTFLYGDEETGYCSCGGRLVEDVEPASEHGYRLVVPEGLWGSRLHRLLERRICGEGVELVEEGRGGRSVRLLGED
jgi:hypothetical protein